MAGDALLLAGAACALLGADTIELDAPVVRLRDVVSLDCVVSAQRETIGDLSFASLHTSRRLNREAIAALVRRRVPALGDLQLAGAPDATVTLQRRPAESEEPPCYVARAPIPAGALLRTSDLSAHACREDAVPASLRYDRDAGAARTRAAIAEGEYIGRVAAAPSTMIDEGQSLTLLVSAGPVAIRRDVEAVSASRGGAVFVRDVDGHVFAAPVAP